MAFLNKAGLGEQLLQLLLISECMSVPDAVVSMIRQIGKGELCMAFAADEHLRDVCIGNNIFTGNERRLRREKIFLLRVPLFPWLSAEACINLLKTSESNLKHQIFLTIMLRF